MCCFLLPRSSLELACKRMHAAAVVAAGAADAAGPLLVARELRVRRSADWSLLKWSSLWMGREGGGRGALEEGKWADKGRHFPTLRGWQPWRPWRPRGIDLTLPFLRVPSHFPHTSLNTTPQAQVAAMGALQASLGALQATTAGLEAAGALLDELASRQPG